MDENVILLWGWRGDSSRVEEFRGTKALKIVEKSGQMRCNGSYKNDGLRPSEIKEET